VEPIKGYVVDAPAWTTREEPGGEQKQPICREHGEIEGARREYCVHATVARNPGSSPRLDTGIGSELLLKAPFGRGNVARLHGAERIDTELGNMGEDPCESECSPVAATAQG